MKPFLLFLLWGVSLSSAFAQQLKPGFDGDEYREMIQLFHQQVDTAKTDIIPKPVRYERLYRSPESELKNLWELWKRTDGVGVICIRGTVQETPSWLENFYAAMIPATGELKLGNDRVFRYQLAQNPRAMVHVGWTIGLSDLAPTIVEKIQELYKTGTREFLIMGHSQGGALAYLTRAYLADLVNRKEIPQDIRFKTYCSAAPKPGNLYFAYDYEFLTRDGWSYTVLNASDWVPETPFSIQTLSDFNKVNPFESIRPTLKKQPFIARIVLSRIFNRMDRATRIAEKRFRKNLGKMMYSQIKKYKKDLPQPDYEKGNNYMRAGSPIILQPNDAYRQQYPDSSKNIFIHHLLVPYYTLSQTYYPGK
ncbi:lipase [Siphonobacter sp. SORGH_AS_0500]|uniref:lipase family protein n=1 Tax=Siphonobacter sp. SORGH_AS_0500 TaxID=1864824 RepID=UPI000CBA7F6B|nr:lipase [Siphonobacter sp. SORGH_AS_0500]PKK36828.1 lipase [Siphonobacter sp. SORGH_AS_0500]